MAKLQNRNVLARVGENVDAFIVTIGNQRVILDADLAQLYGVPTKVLNQAIKRNASRFPADFMFQLSEAETAALRSQNVTSNVGRGGRRYRPFVFTEHGVVMAANVLNSPRAVQISVLVIRTFVRLRQLLATHADLARKLVELENKYDRQFKVVFDAIRQLMAPPEVPAKPPIGFVTETIKTKRRALRTTSAHLRKK